MRFVFFLFICTSCSASAQHTITGTFPFLANQTVALEGFDGLTTYPISSTHISAKGHFQLGYTPEDYGIGYLKSADNKPFFVILSGEVIVIAGEAFSNPETINVLKGEQNQHFARYASEHPRREQALNAWIYLEKIYQFDSLFAVQPAPRQAIASEMQRIKAEDSAFIAGLDPRSYVSWYLPVRSLVSSVSTIAQYRTEEIPATIAAFRALDYTDPRLYKSGLLRDAVESYFWLIENSGRSLDSVFKEMKVSIDHIIDNLSHDEQKFNEITDYLFDLLERHSLFDASEYLALKVLNEVTCTIDSDLAKQLETYRAMKKGNIAPDIIFEGTMYTTGYRNSNAPQKLSDIESDYTVVVFGASWCPKCTEEIPEIAKLYSKWKAQGVEVVYVSLDESEKTHKAFAGGFPFISTCDYLKWDSPVATAYYVFATPTMYLLDKKREILLRPNSVNQMDAWVDWFLVQKNR